MERCYLMDYQCGKDMEEFPLKTGFLSGNFGKLRDT